MGDSSLEKGQAPRADWISAWCLAGARASHKRAWLDESDETCTDQALGEVARNKTEPSDLIEVAETLLRHGAYVSGDDIAFAFGRSPANPTHVMRWKRVWRDAACATMASLFHEMREREERGDKFFHPYTEEIEDLLSTGYTGSHLDEALHHVDRARMQREDFDWQLERERTRMRDEDLDEDRCKLQRMMQERQWMRRHDRPPLALREQMRLHQEDHREGRRRLSFRLVGDRLVRVPCTCAVCRPPT